MQARALSEFFLSERELQPSGSNCSTKSSNAVHEPLAGSCLKLLEVFGFGVLNSTQYIGNFLQGIGSR